MTIAISKREFELNWYIKRIESTIEIVRCDKLNLTGKIWYEDDNHFLILIKR